MDEVEERLAQIEKVASSIVLRGSESLCKLLRYLGHQALEHPGNPVREYQIATQVFGRPAEFDPRMDSTVRVQTGRLRAKLAEYYRVTGVSDPMLVEIPKGSYQLSFRIRPVVETPGPEPAAQLLVERARKTIIVRRSFWVFAFAGMSAVALALALFLVFRPVPHQARAATTPGDSLERFWRSLLEDPSRPVVAFHSGAGETIAVHELDGLFAALGHFVPVKPMAALSQPDLESGDVIFLGPPPDNSGLRGFHFQTIANGPWKDATAILNLYPLPGEPAQWAPDPATEDYAVISLEPGSLMGRWLLTLAGTNSAGTQAAADFVSHEDTMRTLLEKTGRGRFEALIHTQLRNGLPANTQLVLVHSAE